LPASFAVIPQNRPALAMNGDQGKYPLTTKLDDNSAAAAVDGAACDGTHRCANDSARRSVATPAAVAISGYFTPCQAAHHGTDHSTC
jgi:hypothetical protein